MLPITWTTIRLFLHVLGATVWVGGQITMLKLLPGLRTLDPDAPRLMARRFNLIAWAAFGLLFATGVWSLLAVDVGNTSTAYQVTLGLKLTVVAVAGVSATAHTVTANKVAIAAWGGVGLLASLAAVFFGILLNG